MYHFVADEHYNHERIIEYCNRPFASVEEMNETLIANHNRVVTPQDTTVHIGDYGFFRTFGEADNVTRRLHGQHIFVKGSHDRWMSSRCQFMWRKTIDGQFVVCCHYAMRTWERAHHGAWQLYGHSHGTLPPIGKQMDVGVDCNNFTPVAFDQIRVIMEDRPLLHDIEHDSLRDEGYSDSSNSTD